VRPGPKRVVPAIDAKPEEWAYLAGFIDGEGCIGTHRKPNGTPRPNISLKQKYPATLYWIEKKFCGSVRPCDKGTKYMWRITSGGSEAVLRGCLPYLQLKRPQAIVALKLFLIYDQVEAERLASLLSRLKRVDYEQLTRRTKSRTQRSTTRSTNKSGTRSKRRS
jgi:hypothetical protein